MRCARWGQYEAPDAFLAVTQAPTRRLRVDRPAGAGAQVRHVVIRCALARSAASAISPR